MCFDVGACLRSEVADGRRKAGGLLELDERRLGCGTELRRLVPGRTSTVRRYLIPVGVKVLLERLHLAS